MPVLNIATNYGFINSSSFSRAFKKYFKMSPSEFRNKFSNELSKIGQLNSKIGTPEADIEPYFCNVVKLLKYVEMNSEINIENLPDYHLAAVTHIGVQGLEMTFEKIIRWAKANGIWSNDTSKMVRVFHDSFKITPPNKVRMTVGTIVDENFKKLDEVNGFKINKSKNIVGRFKINPHDFEKAWSGMYLWMNEQGYRPNDQEPFEIYNNDFRNHPEGKMIVDLCIPIV